MSADHTAEPVHALDFTVNAVVCSPHIYFFWLKKVGGHKSPSIGQVVGTVSQVGKSVLDQMNTVSLDQRDKHTDRKISSYKECLLTNVLV